MRELKTIGHSNRSLADFIVMLRAFRVDLLVDVRKMPMSRFNPQFNKDDLPGALAADGIAYRHMPELGGMRKPRRDSINTAWENASFRGYADYMQTPAFETAISTLLDLVAQQNVAVMCAEAVPWRCHRSLIADAVTAKGVAVRHILGVDRSEPHHLTSFAKAEGGRVTYPSGQDRLF